MTDYGYIDVLERQIELIKRKIEYYSTIEDIEMFQHETTRLDNYQLELKELLN